MNNTGSLEILNSGYTNVICSINDSGDLNVSGGIYDVPSYTTAGLTSDQTIPNSDTIIQFTAISDPNSWWKTTGSPAYRFQPTRSGVYVITYSVLWNTGSGSGQLNTQIQKNGSQILISQTTVNTVNPETQNNTSIISLNGSTDYITITAYSSSSSTQSIAGNAQNSTTIFNAYLLK